MKIKFRNWFKGVPPRRIKLEIPGWAGHDHNHDSGSAPQPWHCPPFVEGSTYGLELIYPFDTECRIKNVDGKIIIDGDFSQEEKECGIKLPPFASFAPNHYGFTSSLDIMAPKDHIIRLEPHPRFYTDATGNVPCAVTGHLQTEWWPRVFFVVFKSPFPGQEHIFRKDEPFAQVLVLPKRVDYEIEEMSCQEAKQRGNQEKHIDEFGRDYIAKCPWVDHKGNKFDDKYKVLQNAFAKNGYQGVQNTIDNAITKYQAKQTKESIYKRKRMKRSLIKREALQNKKKK
jgi:hypothetical protein